MASLALKANDAEPDLIAVSTCPRNVYNSLVRISKVTCVTWALSIPTEGRGKLPGKKPSPFPPQRKGVLASK